jgi:hypothetical protein
METANPKPLRLRALFCFSHPAEPLLHRAPGCDRIGAGVDLHIIPPHHHPVISGGN